MTRESLSVALLLACGAGGCSLGLDLDYTFAAPGGSVVLPGSPGDAGMSRGGEPSSDAGGKGLPEPAGTEMLNPEALNRPVLVPPTGPESTGGVVPPVEMPADAGTDGGTAAEPPPLEPPPQPVANLSGAFDHYTFARGQQSFVVNTGEGLLRNDDPGARVLEALTTATQGAVSVNADGSFAYSPPNPEFWGDDYFEYRVGAEPIGVRLTVLATRIEVGTGDPLVGNGFAINGPTPLVGPDDFYINPFLGASLAALGDVNGDGAADIGVSAGGIGRVMVIFGKADRASIDLDSFSRSAAFIISGGVSNIVGLGDVNADGFDDVGATGAGAAYVILGGPNPTNLSIDTLIQADTDSVVSPRGAVLRIPSLGESGPSIAGAGDVNADGFDDIVVSVGEYDLTPDDDNTGRTFVIYGANPFYSQQLDNLVGGGFSIDGSVPGAFTGGHATGAGDVNGDGFDDIVIGTQLVSYAAGEAYVLLGGLALGNLTTADLIAGRGGFVITGAHNDDQTSNSLAPLGDVNGDGLDDILVGAYLTDLAYPKTPETGDSGTANIVFGKRDTDTVLLSVLGPPAGFRINGAYGEDLLATAGSGVGDLDGDGYDDILLGCPAEYRAIDGLDYLAFGGPNRSEFSVEDLEGDQDLGVTFVGPASALFSFAVSGAGDLNRDGLPDLLLGAQNANSSAGQAYAIFGWDARNQLGDRHGALIGDAAANTLTLSRTNLIAIDGGHGTDTLRFDGANLTLDLTTRKPRVTNIERIDLTGTGDNTVILDDAAIRRIPENRSGAPAFLSRTLAISGNAGDRVILDTTGYQKQTITNAGLDVWVHTGTPYGLEISPDISIQPR